MTVVSQPVVYCPVCQSDQTHFALKIKDFSVSGEFFEVLECSRCSLRFTKNTPSADQMGRYYQSENYISHSNTKKGLVNRLYHIVRNHTMASKFHLLEKVTKLQSARHLDIGAGTGAFVQYMNKKGWKSIGVEPDAEARRQAILHHDTSLLAAEEMDSFPPESFDAITLWHVLEHVHDLYPYMSQIKKMLNTRGVVLIAVPNYTSYDGRKYGSAWAAYDVPRHLYHFSPDAMRWLLQEAGFQLVEEVPMWWDSFYISLLSEKYAGHSSALVNGFLTGLRSNWKTRSDKEKCSSLIYVAQKV
jgi:2-polyprenyl-3-methyl-5-hydroxy-6-metoxy-1,4-benzoquinol methylase